MESHGWQPSLFQRARVRSTVGISALFSFITLVMIFAPSRAAASFSGYTYERTITISSTNVSNVLRDTLQFSRLGINQPLPH